MAKFTWLCTSVLLSLVNSEVSAVSLNNQMMYELARHSRTNCSFKEALFSCDNGHCIPAFSICNTVNDCGDNSDEELISCCAVHELCKSEGHCSHSCVFNVKVPVCVCPPGYRLENNQTCENMNPQLEDPEHAILTYYTGSEIHGFNLFNNESKPSIVTKLDSLEGLSLDATYIYWTKFNSINPTVFRAFKNGTAARKIAVTDIGIIKDISVDWITGNIYVITGVFSNRIGVCTNSGSHCTLIITEDQSIPKALALHPTTGQMYWSDCTKDAHIYRAEMNGKSQVAIVSDDLVCPNHLTIDYTTDRLYWAEDQRDIIESINPDGTDRRTIVVTAETRSIAVFKERLFWTQWGTTGIQYCNKFTGEENGMFLQDCDEKLMFQIDQTVLKPNAHNPCKGNPCEEVCLLAADHKYTCACSPYKTLREDGKSCEQVKNVNHLILAVEGLFVDYNPEILNKAYSQLIDTPDRFAEVYDSNNRGLLGNNNQIIFHEISRIYGGKEIIGGVAFDHIGNSLYSVNVQNRSIEIMSLLTLKKTLLPFSEEPRSILLIPELSIMFVTLCDKSGCHIDKMSMTGRDKTRFLKESFVGPRVSVVFDTETERVYWADQGTGRIESVSLEGTDRKLFYSHANEPVSMAIHGTKVFWSQENNGRLNWVEKKDSRIGGSELAADESDMMHLITMRGNYSREQSSVSLNASGSTDQLVDTAENYSRGNCETLHLLNSQTCQNMTSQLKSPEHALLIYWTESGLHKFELSTNESQPPMEEHIPLWEPHFLDAAYIYWTGLSWEIPEIIRAFQDGTRAETIAVNDTGTIIDLSVDWITGNIYFIEDRFYNQIGVCTHSGSHCTLIIAGDRERPTALALHPTIGKMYWSDCNNHAHIHSSEMNGKSRVAIVTDDFVCPTALTIDYADDRLYWANPQKGIIESVNLDGSDRKNVLYSGEIMAISVSGNTLFLAKGKGSDLYYYNKFTGNEKGQILGMYGTIWKFQIDHTMLKLDVHNPCKGNPCEEICLLAADHNYTCACSLYKTLGKDGKSCERVEDVDHLIIAAGDVFIDYYPEILSKEYFKKINTSNHFAEVYNPNNQSLLSNNSQKIFDEISRIYGGNETIGGVAFDHIGNSLYSANVENKSIDIMSLVTLEKTHLNFSEEPRSILLIPELSTMFVTLCDGSGCHIDKMSMTGSGRTRFLKDNFVGPRVSIAFDTETERVYWADQKAGKIESVSLNGTSRKIFTTNAYKPVSLAIHKARVFWAQKNSPELFWVKKAGSRIQRFESMPTKGRMMHLITTRGDYSKKKSLVSPVAPGTSNQLVNTAGNHSRGNCTTDHLLNNQTYQDLKLQLESPEHALLIYWMPSKIHKFDLSTSKVEAPLGVHVNYLGKLSLDATYIYWTELYWKVPKISRALKNGTAAETIAVTDAGTIIDLSVDWITGNIYFIDDLFSNRIGVCTNSGSHCTLIIAGDRERPKALAIHPTAGKMYWSDCNKDAHIYRAEMNGKSRVAIVSNDLVCANHLTIDYTTDRLYWVKDQGDIIESISLDGTARRTVLRPTHTIKSIAVFEDRLFWIDNITKGIQYCNKSTGNERGMLLQGVNHIWKFQIDHTVLKPNPHNPCKGNPCEEICLLTADHKYTCACSLHKTLRDDGKSCKGIKHVNHLIIASGEVFIDYYHDLEKRYWKMMKTSDDFAEVYNPNNQSSLSNNSQRIFQEISRIYRVNETISGVAFDHIGNSLYSANVQNKSIDIMSLVTLKKTHLNFSEEPRSILLIPELSIMFVSFCDESGCHIDKMSMTGSGRTRFLKDTFVGPRVPLAFDTETERIYWADEGRGMIESVSLVGTDRKLFYSHANKPGSLAIHGTEVFWVENVSKTLFWKDKDSKTIGSQWISTESDIMQLITTRGNYTTKKSLSPAATGFTVKFGNLAENHSPGNWTTEKSFFHGNSSGKSTESSPTNPPPIDATVRSERSSVSPAASGSTDQLANTARGVVLLLILIGFIF